MTLAPRVARAIRLLQGDLEAIFGARLVSLVLYGRHAPGSSSALTSGAPRDTDAINTLALVSALPYADLAACAARAEAWDDAGLAMPLLLSPREFASSLDTFPLEYGAIITRHLALVGDDPFKGVSVRAEDRRRACETQAKSHLIHLREGFLAAGGKGGPLIRLILRSIASLETLLANLADLDRADHSSTEALVRYAAGRVGLSETLAARLLALPDSTSPSEDEAAQLYPPYLEASERLARFVDEWKESTPA